MDKYVDFSGRPTAVYHRDQKAFANFLRDKYLEIAQMLQKELEFNPDSPKVIRQVEIMRQVHYMIRELDEPIYRAVESYIKKSYMDGRAFHMLSVGDAQTMSEALRSQSWNRINVSKVDALIADTYKDILLATHNTEEHIKQVVRDTVRNVAQYHSVMNTNYKEQAEQLMRELSKEGLSEKIVKEGFVGVVDRAGRKWDLGVYSNMVMKTKINDAFKEGVMQRAKDTGFDLAVISSHGAKDACRKWEGVVVSMTGATKGFPTYAEARSTNEVFHPNCEHTLHPIRNLDMLHPDDKAIAEKKVKELGYETPKNPITVKTDTKPPQRESESLFELVKRTDTQFYSKMGEKHYNNFFNILQSAPVQMQRLWSKYEADIRANDLETNGGAYYSPSKQGVYMNVEKDSKGSTFSKPYQVVFHEFAHNIDFLINAELGGSKYQPFSYTYENNKFGRTLQKEWDERVKAIEKDMKEELKENIDNLEWLYERGYISEMHKVYYTQFPEEYESYKPKIKHRRAVTYKVIEKELWDIPLMERANLSDIIEGASKAKVRGGVGHGKSYWKDEENLPCEAFAEMIDSSIANPDELNQIKKYFPESYKVFEEMIEVVLKQGADKK